MSVKSQKELQQIMELCHKDLGKVIRNRGPEATQLLWKNMIHGKTTGFCPNLYVFCVALPIIGTNSSNEYWIILKIANSGTIYFFPHISFPSVTPSSTLKAEAGGSTLTPIYKAIMGTIPF